MRIAFISCVKSKQAQPAMAKDLYTSALFTKSLAYATARYDAVYILSAKYQLVALTDVIEPYELTLNTMPASHVRIWSMQTAKQIRAVTKPSDTFYFIAGERYHKELIPLLPNTCVVLFKGLGLGKRLQALQ